MPTMRQLIDLITADQPAVAPQRGPLSDYLDGGRYQRLDEADRGAFLLKLYGAKLADKFTASEAREPIDVAAAVQHAPGADLGQKMLAYLTTFDPSPTHEYLQWLCVRYLKNQFRLEDGPRAHAYLALFHRVKRIQSPQVAHRITNKNIMSYDSLDALFSVLEPFMTDVEHTPTGGTEEERLARRMAQDDQAQILYDGPDMFVVTPHTEAAAKFWGRDTVWCTTWGPPRINQFAYYNSFGPLYIVTLKPGGEKYQLSFDYVRGGNSRGEFMDKNDRRIDIAAFMRAHPRLIQLVGETKLVPWATTIGLDLFSPAMAKMITAQQAGQQLARRGEPAALAQLPADIVANYEFQKALLSERPAMLAQLPQAAYAANLIVLLRECVGLFQFVPPELRTPETAEAASLTMRRFTEIETLIPTELWTPVVATRYWELRAALDFDLRLASVPAAYRTPEVIVKLLARHPEDIAEFTAVLTGRIARDIVRTDWTAGLDLPGKYFNEAMAATLVQLVHKASLALFARIPAPYWTAPIADTYVRLPEASFAKLPERFHDISRAAAFIATNPEKVDELPRTLIQPETLTKLDGATFITLLKHAAPGVIGDDAILAFARRCPNAQIMEEVAAALPDRDLTPAVLAMLLHRGLLPISRIPAEQLTDDAIVRRMETYDFRRAIGAAELEGLPPERLTPDLAARLTLRQPLLLRVLPDSALSPEVLSNVVRMVIHDEEMRSRRYSTQKTMDDDLKAFAKASLARFPLADWTPKDLVSMIDRALFLPNLDDLPPHLLEASVINAVDSRDPTQIGRLPNTPAIERQLVRAVRRRWEIILHVRKAQLTVPLMRAVLHSWAYAAGHQGYISAGGYLQHVANGAALRAALLALPRARWNEGCYEAAVVDLLPLAKIPPARRTDAVLKAALLRAPETIKAIADPVPWLDHHVLASDTTPKWRKAMEEIGFVMRRGKWASTRDDLAKIPLDGHPGFTVSVVSRGTTNRQVYLFKDGKPVLVLRTDAGRVRLDNAYSYRAYRSELITVAQTYLKDFALGDLEKLDIYEKNGVIGSGDDGERTTVGALQWGDIKRRDGHIYIGYLRGTKLIQVYTTYARGSHRAQQAYSDKNKIFDFKLALAHASDIVAFLEKHYIEYFWELHDIGIQSDRHGGLRQVARRQVGTIGGLGVWTDGTQLNVYGPMGWLAGGRVLVSGRLSRFEVNYRYQKLAKPLEAALGQIAAHVVAKSGTPLALPLDVQPDPKD